MFSEIITLEQSYNARLPATRVNKSPGEDLRAAARAWSDKVWEKALEPGPGSLSSDQLEDGRRLIQHPVFICGVHRSGTTLVRDLLDSHPDLIVLPSEGTYYTNLEHKILALPESKRAAFLGKEWLRRLVNPTNQSPYWLLGRSSEDYSLYVEFARYVLSWWQIINHNKSSQSPQVVIMLAYASCMNHLDAKHWVDKTPVMNFF